MSPLSLGPLTVSQSEKATAAEKVTVAESVGVSTGPAVVAPSAAAAAGVSAQSVAAGKPDNTVRVQSLSIPGFLYLCSFSDWFCVALLYFTFVFTPSASFLILCTNENRMPLLPRWSDKPTKTRSHV